MIGERHRRGIRHETHENIWLKDKYGLSWQIVPTALPQMLKDTDVQRSKRVMQALMQMKKIDVARLKQAYAGEPVAQ